MSRLAAVVAFALALAGCSSPEAKRVRGGGLGADVGNHGAVVELHGRRDVFFKTPIKKDLP